MIFKYNLVNRFQTESDGQICKRYVRQQNICYQLLGFLICDKALKSGKAENGFISSKEIHGSSVTVFQKKSKILTGT